MSNPRSPGNRPPPDPEAFLRWLETAPTSEEEEADDDAFVKRVEASFREAAAKSADELQAELEAEGFDVDKLLADTRALIERHRGLSDPVTVPPDPQAARKREST